MLTREFLAGCARAYPEKAAFLEGDRRRSWSEFEQRVLRLASVWMEAGIGNGDVVAILAKDRIELVEHFCACMAGGVLRVGINWRYAPAEMLHILRDCNARMLIVDATCAQSLAGHYEELRAEGRLLVGFGEGHGLDLDYETMLAGAAIQPMPAIEESDLAAITYTTGTTGMPKGALWSHLTVRTGLVQMVAAMNLVHEDVWLTPAPGAGAPILFMHFGLINGMTTVLPGSFHAPDCLRDVERFGVTGTLVIPTMLRRLLEESEQHPFDLSTLRKICYGSMPAPVALLEKTARLLPDVQMLQLYGGTETAGGPVAILTPGDHRAGLAGDEEILKSCGRPQPHMQVEVRGEDGRPLAAGEIGEVWMKGDVVMLGYHHLPEQSRERLREGWVSMGDLGYFDARRYLYLVDRKNFMIISGGYNVYPVVVENVLSQHPAVREVAVVGVPHPEWGEAVVAAVSLVPGGQASEEEVIAFCRGRVGLWEVPKAVLVLEDLPKGSTGKIQKKQIQQQLAEPSVRLPWRIKG